MNLNWWDSVKSNNLYEIICDRVYPLITASGMNRSTDFCYHILFEGTVNGASRTLGSKLRKITEYYLKNPSQQGQMSILPINKNSETNITLTIYSNFNNSKIFNLSNIKHNTIELSQKVVYTSIHGFLPHQLLSSKCSHNL